MSDSATRSPVGSAWELLETKDLRRILQLQPAKEEAAFDGEFPGIVARRNGANPGLVAIGYGIGSQSVLTLTTPFVLVLKKLSVDEMTDVLTRLLDAATPIAFRNDCRSLRCLVPVWPSDCQSDASTDALRTALAKREFACLAEIGEWQREDSLTSEIISQELRDSSEIQCDRIRVDRLREAQTCDEIQQVLENILLESSDLPNLPRPVASEMMAQWSNQGAHIILLRVRSKLAGICAFEVTRAEHSPDAALSVWLQYIGVAKEFRNQRFARRMIEALVTDCLTESVLIRVSVTADRTNIAAVRLYESMGFRLQSGHEVWTKQMTSSANTVSRSADPETHRR